MRFPLLAILGLAACGHKQDGPSLSQRATARCHDVETQLLDASRAYAKYAAATSSAQLSAEQQQRAALDLAYGTTPKERSIAAHSLHEDLLFCIYARAGEEARLDAISTRLTVAVGNLSSSDAPPQIASAIEELAAVAKEANALPMRE